MIKIPHTMALPRFDGESTPLPEKGFRIVRHHHEDTFCTVSHSIAMDRHGKLHSVKEADCKTGQAAPKAKVPESCHVTGVQTTRELQGSRAAGRAVVSTNPQQTLSRVYASRNSRDVQIEVRPCKEGAGFEYRYLKLGERPWTTLYDWQVKAILKGDVWECLK